MILRVITRGGVAAAIDLGLYVVEMVDRSCHRAKSATAYGLSVLSTQYDPVGLYEGLTIKRSSIAVAPDELSSIGQLGVKAIIHDAYYSRVPPR
jgi:hypothetical protein